jgi:transposase-like protein
MAKESTKINWQHIINLYNSYEGTMAQFCKEHNITRNQLYYHRSKATKKDSVSFYPINLKSKNSLDASNKTSSTHTSTVKISIGNANIHIPTSEKTLLIDILKELM